MLPPAAVLILPKEGSLFSGEMVVEASGPREDCDNVCSCEVFLVNANVRGHSGQSPSDVIGSC